MSESWCALLDVLILSIVATANGVLIHRTKGLEKATGITRSAPDDG